MKLFYSPTSPYVRKVRVAAAELGLADRIELVAISAWTDESLRAFNPFCQVPTLVMDNGEGLYDSAVICAYLVEQAGRALPGATGVKALKLEALGDNICAAAVRRVREEVRPEGDRHADVIARQTTAITAGLDVLEREASGLSGFGLGEISVAITLGYLNLRFPGLRWADGRPALKAWFDSVADRPSMAATVPTTA